MAGRSRSPDVVLVVMDCVRQDFFARLVAERALPFLAAEEPNFSRFGRAVAPGSWTIPSHASLFTGKYPWDHGAHYRAGATLGPSPPTLAEFLRGRGYRTVSLSANGYVQPATGLTRGFDRVLWGGDQEFFLRFRADVPSCPSLNGRDAAVHALLDHAPGAPALRVGMMRALSRFTPLCDALNRVGGRIGGRSPAEVGGWIEEEFDRALTADGPVFLFVNLLEAHEPYLAEAGLPIGLGDWLSYARTTQVSELWKTGDRAPSARDLAWARRGYSAALRVIDRRVARLVERLRARSRWDNTLFVLTSDHGQAFGEGGSVYHRLNLQEPITRVPLWVRFPERAAVAPRADDVTWVSLTDVPATAVHAVDPDAKFGDPESVPLGVAIESSARSVYAMTDGLPVNEASRLSPERREQLDRVQIAAYRGSFKAILDQGGGEDRLRVNGFDVSTVGTGEEFPDFPEVPPRLRAVLSLPEPTSVSQRIAGWGY